MAWPIVGRTDALATVLAAHDAVARDGGRVVAITGEAGIGKTRLAAESIARWGASGATVLGATAYPAERGIAYAPIVDLLAGISKEQPPIDEAAHRVRVVLSGLFNHHRAGSTIDSAISRRRLSRSQRRSLTSRTNTGSRWSRTSFT